MPQFLKYLADNCSQKYNCPTITQPWDNMGLDGEGSSALKTDVSYSVSKAYIRQEGSPWHNWQNPLWT